MNLDQIKTKLNVVALDLVRCLGEDGKTPTEWLRHWDNKERVAVVVHQDVLKIIKDTPKTNKLALKYEQKVTKTGDLQGITYDSYILIHADSIEESL